MKLPEALNLPSHSENTTSLAESSGSFRSYSQAKSPADGRQLNSSHKHDFETADSEQEWQELEHEMSQSKTRWLLKMLKASLRFR